MKRGARSILVGCALALCVGCGAQTTSRVPGGTSIAYEPANDGWMELHEPGWFVVNMPTAPLVTLVDDRSAHGPFTFKKLRLQSAEGLFVVQYVEFGSADDALDALQTLRDRWSTDGAKVSDVDVEGVRATEIRARLPPRSEQNDSDVIVATRMRLIVTDRRFFSLRYAAPAATASDDADAFFASFHFDRR